MWVAKQRQWILVWALTLAFASVAARTNRGIGEELFQGARRVVFLGDSITYAGDYVALFELAVRLQFPDKDVEFINLGLPSETVSGLSEPGHAGGSFPRPVLHERLGRILEKVQPDLVFACYGMNCGIYHPYSDDRLDSFREGIRSLKATVRSSGARLILLTPPVFDPLPILDRTLPDGETEYRNPYRSYNEVLDLYSAWLVAAQAEGWIAIDTHSSINHFLEQQRASDPQFTFAADGIHPNSQGHWLIAREIIRALGRSRVNLEADQIDDGFRLFGNISPLLDKIRQRQRLLTDSWLAETGHQRPGMNRGEPLARVQAQVEVMNDEIRKTAASIAALLHAELDK